MQHPASRAADSDVEIDAWESLQAILKDSVGAMETAITAFHAWLPANEPAAAAYEVRRLQACRVAPAAADSPQVVRDAPTDAVGPAHAHAARWRPPSKQPVPQPTRDHPPDDGRGRGLLRGPVAERSGPCTS